MRGCLWTTYSPILEWLPFYCAKKNRCREEGYLYGIIYYFNICSQKMLFSIFAVDCPCVWPKYTSNLISSVLSPWSLKLESISCAFLLNIEFQPKDLPICLHLEAFQSSVTVQRFRTKCVGVVAIYIAHIKLNRSHMEYNKPPRLVLARPSGPS